MVPEGRGTIYLVAGQWEYPLEADTKGSEKNESEQSCVAQGVFPLGHPVSRMGILKYLRPRDSG